ncbi:unnamed protein product [Owenia fusiformis]|uniref:Uncharacterized protein n=1 Tax=Owenia fusiformis TaxID=6347 RepID=A0A8J1U062_OWEFU|nr:unnamed protein product [Owenia fusiformis]
MNVDLLSRADNDYFKDDPFAKDDLNWDANLDKFDDLASFLDVEANVASDELMKQLPDVDFDLPMLPDDTSDLFKSDLDPWNDLGGDSSSDSGISGSGSSVKQEPLSPSFSHSSDDGSLDSFSTQTINDVIPHIPPSDVCVKAEELPGGSTCTSQPFLISPTTLQGLNKNINILPAGNIVTSQPQNVITNGLNSAVKSNITQNGNTIVITTNLADLNGTPANKKMKLQPKPVPLIQPKTVLNTTNKAQCTTKPLVLTPEEFTRLTQQGLLKFQPPPQESKPPAPPAGKMLIQATSQNHNENDLKVVKRQQRMIKNRESASLSRKRKKEYVGSLEERLAQSYEENQRLKEENDKLKQRLSVLQGENEMWKRSFPNISKTKATVVLTIMLMVGLNLGPLTDIFSNSSNTNSGLSAISPGSKVHVNHQGRHLMSVPEEPSYPNISEFVNVHSPQERGDLMWINSSIVPDSQLCPLYFNKTESLRLANELTGWVERHKELKKKERQEKERIQVEKERLLAQRVRKSEKKKKLKVRPLRKLRAAMDGQMDQQLIHTSGGDGQYSVQVFNGRDNYLDFLDSIHRRNDTFYVVSFNKDHLLLPATAHNKTMRPRMSLVVPTVASLNETMAPPAGSIAMIQIDCEVMNTRLLHIKESVIPAYMRENNATFHHKASP